MKKIASIVISATIICGSALPTTGAYYVKAAGGLTPTTAAAAVTGVVPNDPNPNTPLQTSKGISIDEFDSLSSWSTKSNSTVEIDNSNLLSGTASIKITSTAVGGGGEFSIVNTTNQNLSSMKNLEFGVYVPDPSQITTISIRFYSDDNDNSYYSTTINGDEFNPGWNVIRRAISDIQPHEGSTASLSSIKRIAIVAIAGAGKNPSINIDRMAYNVEGRTKILFTFDDAWYSVFTNAEPIMKAKGLEGTVYANESISTGADSIGAARTIMNETDLDELYKEGWDISNHTVHHSMNLDTYSDDYIKNDFSQNQTWLESKGWTRGAQHAAYPSGVVNDKMIGIVKELGIKTGRGVVRGIQPTPVYSMYNLKNMYVEKGNVASVEKQINRAVDTGSTLFLMIHKVEDTPTLANMTISVADFTTIVDYVSQLVQRGSVDVETISEWYDSYMGNTKPVVSVSSVSLSKTQASLTVGANTTLAATVSPANATNKAVTWSSSNTNVATVDSTGKVTAVAPGTAVITVTTDDGKKTATCTVTVNAPVVNVTSVSLDKPQASLTVGQNTTLTATVNPTNATNKAVTWSSSNANVATVDSNGKITAVTPGTAVITVTTVDGSKTASCNVTVVNPVLQIPSVSYQGHVENIGWQGYVKDGALAGTEGKALRVEALRIKLENAPAGLKIKYAAHVENIGWQNWVYDGAMAGTEGKALRMEALQIELEGTDADKYSVQYQACVENEGWKNWVRDGQIAGSVGKAQRLEAVKIKIVEKVPSVSYQGHVENIGWQDYVKDGALAGTEGKALRVEGLRIKLENAPAGLKIKYMAHVENIGWQNWVYDGALAGTEGKALRLEAVQIVLEGTDADKYSVQYQAHVENEGWKDWVSDGQIAGSVGKGQRLEAIRINIVKK